MLIIVPIGYPAKLTCHPLPDLVFILRNLWREQMRGWRQSVKASPRLAAERIPFGPCLRAAGKGRPPARARLAEEDGRAQFDAHEQAQCRQHGAEQDKGRHGQKEIEKSLAAVAVEGSSGFMDVANDFAARRISVNRLCDALGWMESKRSGRVGRD